MIRRVNGGNGVSENKQSAFSGQHQPGRLDLGRPESAEGALFLSLAPSGLGRVLGSWSPEGATYSKMVAALYSIPILAILVTKTTWIATRAKVAQP